jgi:hypothetical protein
LIINVAGISVVISQLPHVEANHLFFFMVKLIEKVTDQMEKVMVQVGALVALGMLYGFRKKIAQLLGFDQQFVRADLRDILTGFSMKRFKAIELSLWHADGIPCGFTSQTLFCRIVLGYNEPAHTRPHDGIRRGQFSIRERLQLNYDPEDKTQKMTITIKQQEFIGTSVNQMLPAAGAVMGALGGMTTPLGMGPGAALGVVTGTGAAHSVGTEIARVDLSSAQINKIRELHNKQGQSLHPRPDSERKKLTTNFAAHAATSKWSEDYFFKVDLIPQGNLWLRIADVKE